MSTINCTVPITVRVAGDPSQRVIEELYEVLRRSVTARLAEAERLITSSRPGETPPVAREAFREPYEPGREHFDADGYEVPIYDRGGEPVVVPFRRRRWRVRDAFTIRIRVSDFADYLDQVGSERDRELRALYPEIVDEIRRAAVWVVVARESILLDDLIAEVTARIDERFVPEGRIFYFVYSVLDRDRLRLAELEQGNAMARVPSMAYNRIEFTADGRVVLARGGVVLFTRMVLPIVRLTETLVMGTEVPVPVRYRDLEFLVDPASFESIFEVSWSSFVGEHGDSITTLRLIPVHPLRRVHFSTINYFVRQAVTERVPHGSWFFGSLRVLSDATIRWLPDAARTVASALTNEATRAVSSDLESLVWDTEWTGAFVYTVLAPTEDQIDAARYAGSAHRLAAELAVMLRGDPRELAWPYETYNWFRDTPSGRGFEFLLAELERLGLLDRLFDAVEEADNWDLHELLIRRATGTRFATHDRVRHSITVINRRRREDLIHAYRREGDRYVLLIEKDEDQVLRPHGIFANIDSGYSKSQTVQRIRPDRMAEFQRRLENEARDLIGEIVSGRSTTEFTETSFAREALARTVRGIGAEEFEDNYVEEIEHTISARLLSITRLGDVIERYEVTFELVDRYGDGGWQTIPGSRRTLTDGAFEEMLAWWPRLHGFAFIQSMATVVGVVAVVAIAWEVGAVAFLVELGGGPVAVGVAIGISELIYLATARRYTLEGFLIAAIDGYLFALGFRFAGIAGRSLATSIGTQTMPRIIGGWVAERLTVGTFGGAGSAALVTFNHDLIGVLLGQGDWSTPEEYVRHMALGAALGVVFEFGIGALQPVLRVGGRTALKTVDHVVTRIRAEGLTLPQWSAWTTEALANLRGRLAAFLEPELATRIAAAFRERLADVMRSLSGGVRTSIYLRVLELSGIRLSRSAATGLEKLLRLPPAALSDDALLAFVNRLARDGRHSVPFLEALNGIDDALLTEIASRGALPTLADAPRILALVGERGSATLGALLEGPFNWSLNALDDLLARSSRLAIDQQERLITVLSRPGQQVPPTSALETMERLGSLDDEVLAGLDRLYGTALDRATVDGILAHAPNANLAAWLRFIGGLREAAVTHMVESGFISAVSEAPNVLAFLRGAGNFRRVARLIGRGRADEVLPAFDDFLARNPGLTAEETINAVDQFRRLGLRQPGEIEAAGVTSAQPGYPGGASSAIEDLHRLMADNVPAPMARNILELPPGETITSVDVAGPGVIAPDVLFTTSTGRHIGREATSSNVQNTTAARAVDDLSTNLMRRVREKVGSYDPRGTSDRPEPNYASREIDVQIRPSRNGINFDDLLTRDFLDRVMERIGGTTSLGRIDRIRFYDSSGNLTYTWTRGG